MSAKIDSSTDLGRLPLGLSERNGRCNYQWGIDGPLGAVIFYCIREKSCDGQPHRVEFTSDYDTVILTWQNEADVKQRRAARRLQTWDGGWCPNCNAPRRPYPECSRSRLIPAFDSENEYSYQCRPR